MNRSGALDLPILAAREEFLSRLEEGPVVVSAPTGSGKSTMVPLWCEQRLGRTLVVEPRRVACRALWRFVHGRLGADAGYVVRHEQERADAQVVYVTPGVALRMAAEGALRAFRCVVLDEFHERSLELDLLAAHLKGLADDGGRGVRTPRLVVMSATLQVERIARWLGAGAVHAQGRTFPVEVSYRPGGVDLPRIRGLTDRILAVLPEALAGLEEGDVLVFLPGKGEISDAIRAISGRFPGIESLRLHAGMPASDQDRVFARPRGRRIVLATNVAESSVTLPWVRVVVDSGLERRTAYRRGRSVLAVSVISRQSADQRAGRAGRLGPGRCIRLWKQGVVLRAETVPEVLREDLDTLVLAASALGKRIDELDFLDRPDPRALEMAESRLRGMGILEEGGGLTDVGRQVANLPLDPVLGRLVVEARSRAEEVGDHTLLEDVVDFVSSLAAQGARVPWRREGQQRRQSGRGRRGRRRRDMEEAAPEEEERPYECDVAARVDLVRGVAAGIGPARGGAWFEARRIARQLRRLLGLPADMPRRRLVNSIGLARTALAAAPELAFVRRKKLFAGGGIEASLGPESFVSPQAQALVVFEVHSVRDKGTRVRHSITCATAVPGDLLVETGLARPVVTSARLLESGDLEGQVNWRFLGVDLRRERMPLVGDLAAMGAARLLLQGAWRKDGVEAFRRQLRGLRLAQRLGAEEVGTPADPVPDPDDPASEDVLVDWLARRLRQLGVTSGRDLELLEPEDLLPPDVDRSALGRFLEVHPVFLALADRTCDVEWEPRRRTVTLVWREGRKDPPPRASELPRVLDGWSVRYRVHSRTWRVR